MVHLTPLRLRQRRAASATPATASPCWRAALLPSGPAGSLGLLLGAAGASCVGTGGVAPPAPLEPELPPEAPFAVEQVALDLSLDPELRTISAELGFDLIAAEGGLGRIKLDFVGLQPMWVDDADDARSVELVRNGAITSLLIEPALEAGDVLRANLVYAGAPVRGVSFEGTGLAGLASTTRASFDAEVGSRAGWLALPAGLESIEGLDWTLRAPAGWQAIGPGARTVSEDGALQFTHTGPLDVERLDLFAGEFERAQLSSGGLEFEFLTQENRSEWLEPCLGESIEVLDYFTYLFGVDYPLERYSQLCLPATESEVVPGGALLPDALLGDEAARRDDDGHGLIASAIARQWLGGTLFARPGHGWLDRGLSAYAALLYTETTRDSDDFGLRLRDAQRRALEVEVPLVGLAAERLAPELFEGLAISRVHLLRKSIGDQAFFDGLADYVSSNRGRRVTTADFQAAMELASSSDLSQLFDDWFKTGGYPELELQWVWDGRASEVVLQVDQVQNRPGRALPVYRAPVQIELRAGPRTSVHRIELAERAESFRFPLEERPTWVRFDRDAALPARVDFERRGDEWLALATRDLEPLGRAEAVSGLGALARSTGDPRDRERYIAELGVRAMHDESEKVRIQAAAELGRTGGLAARGWLEQMATKDEAPSVRVAAMGALENFGASADLAKVAEGLFADTYSWRARAAAASLYASAAPDRAQSWIADRLVIESPQQRLRASLLSELANLPGNQIDRLLLSWANDREAAEAVRIAAVESLRERSPGSTELGEQLGRLLDSRERRVRLSVIQALAGRPDAASRRALQAYAPRTASREEARVLEAVLSRP